MTALPPGLRIALDAGARRGANGTLTGGSPRRAMRLSPAGWSALAALERGAATSPAALALGRRLLDAGLAHPRPRRAPAEVTIVIPARDRTAQLRRCLAGLPSEASVVVVDDGSRDAAAVARIVASAGARLVRRTTPGGPAVARAEGLRHVETDLVALLDSDCVAAGEWLARLVGHFDDPAVAAVAPRIRPLRAGPDAVARYLAARSPLDMGAREAGVEPGTRVPYVPTAALLVRRSALGDGFDEALQVGEDVDFVWRLRDAGARVRYDPSVVVHHDEPGTLRGLLARRWRYGTSAAPLARRHPGRLAPLVVAPRLRPAVAIAVLRYAGSFALPFTIAAAVRARRPAVLALLTLPALDDWRRRRPDLDPLRWVALVLADDATYAAGVWSGSVRTGTREPLLPRLARATRTSESSRSPSSAARRRPRSTWAP